MGKVTAKIMRDAKEARKMGDGGAGGSGGIDVSGNELGGGLFSVDESYPGGAPEAQFNPETGQYETNLPGDVPAPETGPTGVGPPGGVDPGLAGGRAVEGVETPSPRAWEANIEKASEAAEKASERANVTRKKRRRSLLTEEEGGMMSPAPTYRRSILGR